MLFIKNLSAFYGNIEALRAIDLHISPGSVTTIIGSNGAGKSTLLKAISGIVPTKYGTCEYFGKNIANMSPTRIVKMGISHVPEGRMLFSKMTVLQNLELGAYSRRGRKRAAEVRSDMEMVFDLFPLLKERLSQQAGTLSGGEQQMLAIGRGIMSRPNLLMLDEPSLGLAPIIVREIVKVLKNLREQGMTVLLVEQEVALALKNSDYTYIFNAGKVAIEGRSEELIKNDEIRKIYMGEGR